MMFFKRCIRIPALAVIVGFLAPSYAIAHDVVWPGEKLEAMYPSAESFEQKNLYVSDTQQARMESMLGERLPPEDLKPSVYLAIVRNSPAERPRAAAAMIFIDAWGDGGKIEMGVVVSGRGEISEVNVFENNEKPGMISGSFLGQFKGKKAAEPFTVGRDVTAPDIPVKTAQSVASGARRGLVIINEMFRRR